MNSICTIVIASLLGSGCLLGFCLKCVCSDESKYNTRPVIEHVIITREHYDKLNKSTSKLPSYNEAID